MPSVTITQEGCAGRNASPQRQTAQASRLRAGSGLSTATSDHCGVFKMASSYIDLNFFFLILFCFHLLSPR